MAVPCYPPCPTQATRAPRPGDGRLATNTPPALRSEDLARSFGETRAVDGLSFEVTAGETFGLLGHNGAGKTTTIRLLNGVLGRDAGKVEVLGLDPAVDGVRVRARTGVLTETPSLDERLSATENLAFFGRLYGVTGRRLVDQVASLLTAFGLADRASDRVGGFSRGL
jgi:ABC-2 type transport system ATP-binding protein